MVYLQISFSLKENYDDANIIKSFLRQVGCDKVREKLGIYVKELKEGNFFQIDLYIVCT